MHDAGQGDRPQRSVAPYWMRRPTALEEAHYDRLLKHAMDRRAMAEAATQERSRQLFGECLLTLVQLGVREGQARAMLGKWRKQAQNDALLIAIIRGAGRSSVPDPISYVTAAIQGQARRASQVETVRAGTWQLLGWERPRTVRQGGEQSCWRGTLRGQVWRDQFGKIVVLPAKAGVQIPSANEDPGFEGDY